MLPEQIIKELKSNLTRLEQILSLIGSHKNVASSVEMELLQKNITILFENYVRLKLSFEIDEKERIEDSISISKMPIVEAAGLVTETKQGNEIAVKKSFGFSFNLGDDEGKINQTIESVANEGIAEVKNQMHRPFEPEIAKERFEIVSEKTTINTPKLTESEKDLTLNERFSSLKNEPNLASKHLNNPIADLTKEISLNKKFAFVNELFGGDMEQYNTAVTRLNTIGSIEFAHKYLNELKVTLRWNKESNAVADFIDLVERRWEN